MKGACVAVGNIKERVAYLQELTLWLNIRLHSPEGKLLMHIIDVLDDMTEEINNIQMTQLDLQSYIESMDEDLTELEEEVYEDTDEEAFVKVQAQSVTNSKIVRSRSNVGKYIATERCGETCFKEGGLLQVK